MKYYFRDRVESGKMMTVFHKTHPTLHLDHHDYHPHYELYFNEEEIPQEIVVNGRTVCVTCPSAVLTSPFSIHAMSSSQTDSLRFDRKIVYFNGKFPAAFGEGFFPADFWETQTNCLFPLTPALAARIAEQMDILQTEPLPENEQALILAKIICLLTRAVPPERRVFFGKGTDYIPRVLQYLYENCDLPHKSAEIAQRFHVSRAKLDRDFTESVGQTLHQAITDLRLAKAGELLRNTRKTVAEIAAEVGISSEYYFHAFFKRAMGMTPNQYRKEKR